MKAEYKICCKDLWACPSVPLYFIATLSGFDWAFAFVGPSPTLTVTWMDLIHIWMNLFALMKGEYGIVNGASISEANSTKDHGTWRVSVACDWSITSSCYYTKCRLDEGKTTWPATAPQETTWLSTLKMLVLRHGDQSHELAETPSSSSKNYVIHSPHSESLGATSRAGRVAYRLPIKLALLKEV